VLACDAVCWFNRDAGMREAGRMTDRGGRTDALHLFVLTSFALVQPLLSVLGASPEFFLALAARPRDVWVLLGTLSLGVPVVLWLVELLAGLVSQALRAVLHALFVVALGALIVLPLVGRFVPLPDVLSITLALTAGMAAAMALRRHDGLRTFVAYCTPAVIVFPAVFVLTSRAASVAWPAPTAALAAAVGDAAPTAVVLVVFDEFPLGSLLDASGAIDAARHPSFARLAATSTWYRNATSVASMTEPAVAAIVTGRLPGEFPLTEVQNRNENLFTLLAPSHALRVVEAYAPYCPDALCEPAPLAGDSHGALFARETLGVLIHAVLPPSLRPLAPETTLAPLMVRGAGDGASREQELRHRRATAEHAAASNGHRAAEVERFRRMIAPSARPQLYYLHSVLPHDPWVHLPSGARCPEGELEAVGFSNRNGDVLPHMRQRLALQVGFVDRLLGGLIDRLEETGVFERALVMVVADHGTSLRPGVHRRALSREGYCDVARVPLFVKFPGQRAGVVDDRNAEIVDLVPTVADVLAVGVPWQVDGRSLRQPGAGAPHKRMVGPYWPDPVETEFFAGGRMVTLPATVDLGCFDALVEPDAALLQQARVEPRTDVFVELDASACALAGRVTGAAPAGAELAIVRAGRVQAITHTAQRAGREGRFAVTLPDGVDGAEVLLVEHRGDEVVLGRPAMAGAVTRR
jgi:arylsulfatase A-like enzyme